MKYELELDDTCLSILKRYRHPRIRTPFAELDGEDTPSSPAGLEYGKAYEVYGKSNEGKTAILLRIIASLTLAKQYGGDEKRAIYVDFDGTFTPFRLLEVVEKEIQAYLRREYGGERGRGEGRTGADISNEVVAALDRVTYYSCADVDEAVDVLQQIQRSVDAKRSPLLLLDGISQFFWACHARVTMAGQPVNQGSSGYSRLLGCVKDILRSNWCAVVYTRAPVLQWEDTNGAVGKRKTPLGSSWSYLPHRSVNAPSLLAGFDSM
uniref:Rad51-like C-terminal domain-containing protein n=1 Tax=Palpitomonas bilix TaxID=652834 RepID=A0A7S3CXZ0_9EUKA|mmetsp:Transcript_13965/g.35971  ORF Transcript_13965/g.35971 Transcript_13965/m.35971 type:complete len:265 (+) Transcript_13965:175-969(+)